MSEDKKSMLGELIGNVKAGVNNLGAKKERAEPAIDETAIDAAADTPLAEDKQQKEASNDNSELDDLLAEPLDNAESQKPQTIGQVISALSGKQKALLGAALVVAVLVAKMQLETADVTQTPVSGQEASQGQESGISADQESLLAGDFSSTSGVNAGFGEQPDRPELQDDLTLSFDERTGEFASAGLSTDDDLNPLASFGSDEIELGADASKPFEQPTKTAVSASTPEQASASNETPFQITDDSAAPFAEPEQPVFGEATLAGEDLQVVDSNTPATSSNAPVDASTAQKLASLESLVQTQKESIKNLENQLAQVKKTATPQAAPKAVAPIKQARPVALSNPTPKQAPRPRMCVKAVAQAARNCSTCVAHAFVVNGGAETMVGHGDRIDGYRVSIVGDRIDLHGAEGTEPHKFWPSPNGCAN